MGLEEIVVDEGVNGQERQDWKGLFYVVGSSWRGG